MIQPVYLGMALQSLREAPGVVPAGAPPVQPTPVGEFTTTVMRVGVLTASLAAGQWALGEKDAEKVLVRSLTGAVLTEGTARAMRAAQENGHHLEPVDWILLASYGEGPSRRLIAELFGPPAT